MAALYITQDTWLLRYLAARNITQYIWLLKISAKKYDLLEHCLLEVLPRIYCCLKHYHGYLATWNIAADKCCLKHYPKDIAAWNITLDIWLLEILPKKSKTARIRNHYNQVPHLSQVPKEKVTKSQYTPQTRAKRSALSLQVTTRQQWTNAKAWQTQAINNKNNPQKKWRLGTVSENILLEGLNWFHGAPTSPSVQMWIKTHIRLVCMKDP